MTTGNSSVRIDRDDQVAVLRLERGKVNALTLPVLEELGLAFDRVEAEPEVRAVVLTGSGKFFSFGFDVPGMYDHAREQFGRFLDAFTDLYRRIFTFPKPVVAAINGHAIAGGCMLVCACDERWMVRGRAKIALNEIGFGSIVPAGSIEMLKHWVGHRAAERMLLSGEMLDAEQAAAIGLVDRVVGDAELHDGAIARARELGGRNTAAFREIKRLLRDPPARRMRRRDQETNPVFVDVWYSESTREKLREIRIHD